MVAMKKTPLRPVHDLLWRSLSESVRRRMRLQDAARNWESVVGPVLGRRSSLVDLEENRGVVWAESPMGAQELLMRRSAILKVLRERWGLALEDITVRVGAVRLPRPVVEDPVPRDPVPLAEENVAPMRREVRPLVEDETVAESLARMWAAYQRKYPSSGAR